MEEEEEEEKEEERLAPSPEVVLRLLDLDDYLQRIDAYLSGEMIVMTERGVIKKRVGAPLVNQIGRAEILQIMRARLDPVIYSTSILDRDFIRDEVYIFNLNLIALMIKKYRDWGLDVSKSSELVDFLVTAFEATLRKAMEGIFLKGVLGMSTATKPEKRRLPFWPW